MVPIARPLPGVEEQEVVLRVLISGQLARGEYVAAFERRFAEVCHVREAVAVSSGTAALHLALLVHSIGPGDEVIKTAFSFAAIANVILLVDATSVFVDLEPGTYTLDPSFAVPYITQAEVDEVIIYFRARQGCPGFNFLDRYGPSSFIWQVPFQRQYATVLLDKT